MSSFRKSIIVTRTTGSYVDGVWTANDPTTLTIKASVQPLRLDEMQAMPEGRRSSHVVKIYSDTELYPAIQGTGQNADQFTWQSKTWEVIACDAYQMGIISHYKALAVEVTSN